MRVPSAGPRAPRRQIKLRQRLAKPVMCLATLRPHGQHYGKLAASGALVARTRVGAGRFAMVHRNEEREQHRHSSYHPENKNYKREHRRSLVAFANKNQHASNNNHAPLNDNAASVAERLSAAGPAPTSCLGAKHDGADVDNANGVRWSKLLRHDGTPSKVTRTN